ncbi:recombination protein O N-terminal domain-containing protein, partial [Staphylococcus pseudintermedius]|uniref:recombination protein O N-terminal domain-containing protein n=1 Tax=Staphylococcus pseudintermedius TaxID=283734 RepID=UPI0036F244A7
MLVKQKGIIIKAVDYGESDKIITILNEHGAKVKIMVRREKKRKEGRKEKKKRGGKGGGREK